MAGRPEQPEGGLHPQGQTGAQQGAPDGQKGDRIQKPPPFDRLDVPRQVNEQEVFLSGRRGLKKIELSFHFKRPLIIQTAAAEIARKASFFTASQSNP
jgi:hypothetical protein